MIIEVLYNKRHKMHGMCTFIVVQVVNSHYSALLVVISSVPTPLGRLISTAFLSKWIVGLIGHPRLK